MFTTTSAIFSKLAAYSALVIRSNFGNFGVLAFFVAVLHLNQHKQNEILRIFVS